MLAPKFQLSFFTNWLMSVLICDESVPDRKLCMANDVCPVRSPVALALLLAP